MSSGQGWENKQAEHLDQFLKYVPYLMSQGLTGFGFFSMYDNPEQKGWFSSDERHFGMFEADGRSKSAASIWRGRMAFLLSQDRSSPTLLAPLQVVASSSGDVLVSGEAQLSEWARWSITITGERSGARKRFLGAGQRVYFSWDGIADEGAFIDETCIVQLTAQDKAQNALTRDRASRFALRNAPILRALVTLDADQIAEQVALRNGATLNLQTGDEQSAFMQVNIARAHAGIKLPLDTAALALAQHLAHLVLVIDMRLPQNAEGVVLGLEDENAARTHVPVEIYHDPTNPAWQLVRVPLGDFASLGRLYSRESGEVITRQIQWHTRSHLVLGSHRPDVRVDVRRITILSTR